MNKEYDILSLFPIYEDLRTKEELYLKDENIVGFLAVHKETRKVYKKILHFVTIADIVFSGKISLEEGKEILEQQDD